MGMVTSNFIKEVPTHFLRYTKRKVMRFNVVPRAEKVIDSIPETIRPPPKFESTLKQMDRLRKEMPDSFEKVHQKDDRLLKNLEKVYVRSEGNNKDMGSNNTRVSTDFVTRLYEPSQLRVAPKIPKGKYTPLRADQFLCAHAKNPKIFSPEILSLVYDVDERAMRNILTHVKVLTVITAPKTKRKPSLQRFAEDLIPPDLRLEESELDMHQRKLIAASELFEKHYGKNKEQSPEMQKDEKTSTNLTLLERAEQFGHKWQQNKEIVRRSLVEKKDPRTDPNYMFYHMSFMDAKLESIKPEDVSLDKLIEDAIRRSDENERKLQEEKRSKSQEEKRSEEHTLADTVSSQSKVTQPSEKQSNTQVEDSISDEEIERLSKSIQSGEGVKRESVSNTGYYRVEEKRSKKEESN